MAQNDFLQFDENNENVLTQDAYREDEQRISGAKSGVARSSLFNKVLRQVSTFVAGFGQFISEKNINILENIDSVKNALTNLFTAKSIGVSTEVQELLGADNVDDGLKNVPNLLSDYAKIQLIREFTVNSTSGGSGSLGTVASETDFSNFDCFIVKLENFTISLKAQSVNNWAFITLYLRPLNGDNIINDTHIYLGSVSSLRTSTAKTLDLSGKTGFFIATFSKKLTFSNTGNLSTSYGLAINGGNSEPGYSNNPVVGLYASIAYASSPIVKGNVKVYGLKYKL